MVDRVAEQLAYTDTHRNRTWTGWLHGTEWVVGALGVGQASRRARRLLDIGTAGQPVNDCRAGLPRGEGRLGGVPATSGMPGRLVGEARRLGGVSGWMQQAARLFGRWVRIRGGFWCLCEEQKVDLGGGLGVREKREERQAKLGSGLVASGVYGS